MLCFYSAEQQNVAHLVEIGDLLVIDFIKTKQRLISVLNGLIAINASKRSDLDGMSVWFMKKKISITCWTISDDSFEFNGQRNRLEIDSNLRLFLLDL
jgi:hypothetical protein